MALTFEQEETEYEWRIRLMKADIDTKVADMLLKNEQRRWEPWKVIATAMGSAAAVFGALGILVGYLLAHSR